MAFTPVVVTKGGSTRTASSPVELVQLKHGGWVAQPATPSAPVAESTPVDDDEPAFGPSLLDTTE